MTLFYTKWNTPLFEWTTPILKLTCLRKNKHDAHPVMFRTFIPNASRSSACRYILLSTLQKYLSLVHNPANSTAETVIAQRLLEFMYAFISSGVVVPVVGRLNGTNSMRLVTLEKMVWTDIQWAKFPYLYTLHLHITRLSLLLNMLLYVLAIII